MHARIFMKAFADTIAAGFRFNVRTLLLLAAINTGIAAVLWIDDTRPFWHPLLTVQLYGFSIAYCVNAAAPWSKPRPILRLALAVAIGTCIGLLLTILVKGYSLSYVLGQPSTFASNAFAGFANGLFVSLFFYVKFRESQAAAALHKAEVERHLLSKQAIEAELKLMQAQVEPHFLFNTLASVQYLTETNPAEANRLLGHLIEYLRAALPHLRASSTTLRKEVGLAEAYLNILRMRMGSRLAFTIDVPDDVAMHPFPPNLLISLVENAIKHGIGGARSGGVIAVTAALDGEPERSTLIIRVSNTGAPLAESAMRASGGLGLRNVEQRLQHYYNGEASLRLFTEFSGGGALAPPTAATVAQLRLPLASREANLPTASKRGTW
jgi:sensor histidine kinase YesM